MFYVYLCGQSCPVLSLTQSTRPSNQTTNPLTLAPNAAFKVGCSTLNSNGLVQKILASTEVV